MTWSRGLVTGFLLAGVLLFTVACNPDGTSSQPNGNVIFNQTQTSRGCTGSQTVTVQNGDTLTVLVENHVSGSFSVEQTDVVARTYNLIVADFHTYFVGYERVLSHDNTVRKAVNATPVGLPR